MVVVGRAQAPRTLGTPPRGRTPHLHPPADPPQTAPLPPSPTPRVLTDSWGVGRIRTLGSRPPPPLWPTPTNHQPPTATNRQPPTATNCQPPTANL